jgi:hypothetical protein
MTVGPFVVPPSDDVAVAEYSPDTHGVEVTLTVNGVVPPPLVAAPLLSFSVMSSGSLNGAQTATPDATMLLPDTVGSPGACVQPSAPTIFGTATEPRAPRISAAMATRAMVDAEMRKLGSFQRCKDARARAIVA